MRRIRRRRARKARQTRRPLTYLTLEHLEDRTLPSVQLLDVPSWLPQGPGPITGGQVEGLTANNNAVAGAIEAIATDPADANVVYAGSVTGGVWKTENATTVTPTWTHLALDEQFQSLAISSLGIDPTNSNFIYAGTGNFSGFAFDGSAPPGVGLLKSVDAGKSWSVQGRGDFAGSRIRTVLPTTIDNGLVVFVSAFNAGDATRAGLFRSDDGGVSWDRLSGTADSRLPVGPINSIVIDPSDPLRLFARVGGSGIFRSDQGGLHWDRVSAGIANIDQAGRVVLAAQHTATADVVYVALINNTQPAGQAAQFRLTALFRADVRTSNSVPTWNALNLPGDAAGGVNPSGQALVNFALVPDRTDPTVLYVSGDTEPGPLDATHPNIDGARLCTFLAFCIFMQGSAQEWRRAALPCRRNSLFFGP